jgi:membrane protease YdiL (CAAX protease family)
MERMQDRIMDRVMRQGQGVVPQMGELDDSQASRDDPSPESSGKLPRSPRRSAFREVPWRWRDLLLGFAPFLLFSAVRSLIDPQSSLAAMLYRLWMPLTVLTEAWMLVVPLWIARTRNARLARLPRPRSVFVEGLSALLFVPLAFAAFIVVPPLVTYLIGGTEVPGAPLGPLAGSFNRIEWLAFIVLAVLLAPIAEETFYRGFFYNALRQRFHPILAALIQAAVFGYAHPFGLANSVAIGVGALVIALIYEWRKTLLAPILLHAAVNSLGIIFLGANAAAEAATPRLGVYGEAHQGGYLITDAMPGSAADAAGLRAGDVITAVNGEPVADVLGLRRVIRKRQWGDTVSVEFLRGGTAQRLDVVLVKPKE